MAASGLIRGDLVFCFLLGGGLGGGLGAKLKGVALTFSTEAEAVGMLAAIARGREPVTGRLGVDAFAWLLETGGSAGLWGAKLSTVARVEVERELVPEESALGRFDEGAGDEELPGEPSGVDGDDMLVLVWKITEAEGGQAGLTYFE